MKKSIISLCIIVTCCVMMIFTGCASKSTPEGVAKQFLEAVQTGDVDTVIETIRPSEKTELDAFVGMAESATSDKIKGDLIKFIFGYAARNAGLENCYIVDDATIIEDDRAVAFLACEDEEIPYSDSRICLVREDGDWYITFENFKLEEEQLDVDSELTLDEAKRLYDEEGDDVFIKKKDMYTLVNPNLGEFGYERLFFSNDMPTELSDGSELVSLSTSPCTFFLRKVKSTGDTLPIFVLKDEDMDEPYSVYKLNEQDDGRLENEYFELSSLKIDGKELSEDNLNSNVFIKPEMFDNMYTSYVFNSPDKKLNIELDGNKVDVSNKIQYYTVGDFVDLDFEEVKDGYKRLNLDNIEKGMYLVGYKMLGKDYYVSFVKVK